MNAFDILNKLKNAGFSVSFDKDIVLHGQGVLNEELKNLVREHKQELLYHLRTGGYSRLTKKTKKLAFYLDDTSIPLPARKERLPEYEALVDRISELQPYISRYQESGLDRWYSEGWLLLHSDLLNELIVIIRDETVKLPAGCEAYPIYEFKEVEALSGKNDQVIRAAHSTKKAFKGQVVKGGKK